MSSRLAIILMAVLYTRVVCAQWHSDWPISDLTAIPSATYATYMEDLYRATDERIRGTAYSAYDHTAYIFNGTGFDAVNTNSLEYRTDPFTWSPLVPWYIGITNNITITESVRYEQVYTNGHIITNRVVALMTDNDGRVYTNLLSKSEVLVDGVYVTNTAYNISHTNKVIVSRWVTNDAAYNLFKEGMYPIPYLNTTAHWIPPAPSAVLWYGVTNYVLNPSPFWPEEIWGTVYRQVTNVVTNTIPYYLQPATNTSGGLVWSNKYATAVATNYSFAGSSAVIGYRPEYDAQVDVIHETVNAGTVLTYTNSCRPMPDNFGYDMSTLLDTLSDKLIECAPYYAVTTNFSGGKLDSFLSSALTWVWNNPGFGARWTNITWGQSYMTTPLFTPIPTVSALPKWTVSDWLEASVGGTNLYRKTITVDTTAYPTKVGGGYSPSAGPFTVSVDGWTVGDYTHEHVNRTVSIWTNVSSNPQFLTQSNQPVVIPLADVTFQPMWETTVEAKGFSPVFWYSATSAPPYNLLTNVSQQDFIVTNLTWVGELTNVTFTRKTYVKSNEVTYYAGTNVYSYYDGGSAYIVPLVDGYSRIYNLDPDPFVYEGYTADVAAVSWVIVKDLAYGTNLSLNWKALFGTLPNALDKLHQLGYPTKLWDTRVGYKSLGPSGYYYPGGVIQAVTYDVGSVLTLRKSVFKTAVTPSWNYISTTAYPWVLDYMPWDTLIHWPSASVDTALPYGTTSIPAVSLVVTGNILYADDCESLYGFSSLVGTSSTITVTSPGHQSTSPYLALTMNDSRQGIVGTAAKASDIAYTLSPTRTVPYLQPLNITNWPRSKVWSVNSTNVLDKYYTSMVGHASTNVVTNVVVTLSGSTTNYTTNVVIWPILYQTNAVINIPAGSLAVGAKISISTSNNMALYETHSGMINQAALDARYKAINMLKYPALTPTISTVYHQWKDTGIIFSPYWWLNTGGSSTTNTYTSIYYCLQSAYAKYDDHYTRVDQVNPGDDFDVTTSVDIPANPQGTIVTGDIAYGPYLVTNSWGLSRPQWAVGDPVGLQYYWPLTLIWSGSGLASDDTWEPDDFRYSDGQVTPLHYSYTYEYPDTGGKTVKTTRDTTREWTTLDSLDVASPSVSASRRPIQVSSRAPVAEWPKAVQFVTYVDTNVTSDVDVYINIAFEQKDWNQSIPYIGDYECSPQPFPYYTEVFPYMTNSMVLAGTNDWYRPLPEVNSNTTKVYSTVSAVSGVYTANVENIITTPFADTLLSTNIGSWSGSVSVSGHDDYSHLSWEGNHEWDYSVDSYIPYSYEAIYFETIKKPAFKYHD